MQPLNDRNTISVYLLNHVWFMKILVILAIALIISLVNACGTAQIPPENRTNAVSTSNNIPTSEANVTTRATQLPASASGSTSVSTTNSSVPKLTGIHMVSAKEGWATGQVRGQAALWTTRYGGMVWSRAKLPFSVSESTSNQGAAFSVSVISAKTSFLAKVTASGMQTYMTNDGGKTWTKLGTAKTSDTMISTFHFVNANTGWMLTDDGVSMHQSSYHLFHTINGGQSWTLIAQSKSSNSMGYIPGYGDAKVTFDASGGWMTGQSEVTGAGFLMHSVDGGKSWHAISVPVPASDKNRLVTTSKPVSNNGIVSIAVQYQSNQQNATVVLRLNAQGHILSTSAPFQTKHPLVVNFVNAEDGWATDAPWNPANPTLYRTENGGQTWAAVHVNKQVLQDHPNLDFVSSKIGFIFKTASNHGAPMLWHTKDGGQTWSEIYHGGNAISSIDAYGHDVWIDVLHTSHSATPTGSLLFSKDQGSHFSPLSANAFGSIDFVSKTDGFATTLSSEFNSKLLYTTNGGQTWTQKTNLPSAKQSQSNGFGAEGSPVSVSFANATQGIVLRTGEPGAGQQPKSLIHTVNGGKSWSLLSSIGMDGHPKPHQLSSGGYADGIDVVPGHPSSAYIWESRGPMLETTDGGQTWTASKLTEPEPDVMEASCVYMLNAQEGYAMVHDMQPHQYGFILEHTTDGMSSWTPVHKWSYQ